MALTAKERAVRKALRKLTPMQLLEVGYRLHPALWAEGNRIIKGKPWTFEGREYFIEPHEVDAVEIAIQTCSQIGKTNFWMNIVLQEGLYKERSCFVMFPTVQMAYNFSKGKFEQAYKSSPQLANFFTDVENVGHKRAGEVEFFFMGSNSEVGLQNVTAHTVVQDEMDLCREGSLETVEQRRAGVEGKKKLLQVSTPTIPDYGIAKSVKESDGRVFHVKCPFCKRAQPVQWHKNVEWREGLRHEMKRWESARYRCARPQCAKVWTWEMLRHMIKGAGEGTERGAGWIPAKLNMFRVGFSGISHMVSPTVRPWEMVRNWEKAQGNETLIEIFWRFDMGIAYLASDARLSKSLLLRLKQQSGYRSQDESTGSFMGVDVQKGCLYADVSEFPTGSAGRKFIVWEGKVSGFEELAEMMDRYNVFVAVIDGAYDHRKVKEFQLDFEGRVWLAFYRLRSPAKASINEEEGEISLNRTYWLDTMYGRYKRKIPMVGVPMDLSDDYIEQARNLVRITEMNEETGEKKSRYKKIGQDDLAHASLYCEVAASDFEGIQDAGGDVQEPEEDGEFLL